MLYALPLWASAQSSSTNSSTPTTNTQASPTDTSRTNSNTILWLFPTNQFSSSDYNHFQAGLTEALKKDKASHLVTRDQLLEHISRYQATIPDCAVGLETCSSPKSPIFDTLELSLVIRAELHKENTIYKTNYELLDRRGQVFRRAQAQAKSPRELAFAAVRDIFDATGSVTFDSTPRGARVILGDEAVGITPFSHNLSVGMHDYRLEHDHFATVEGVLEITSAGSTHISHNLEGRAGTLHIESAPPGARLLINGDDIGDIHQPIELQPGSYAIEVEADGFQTYREMIRVGAGASVTRRIEMEPHHPLLRKIPLETIVNKRYSARLSLEQGMHSTTFRNARAQVGSQEYEFRNFVDPDSGREQNGLNRFIAPSGLRLEGGYSFENFGLTVLSLSYLSSSPSLPATLESRENGERLPATITGIKRLQIRPFQISYRYFYENLAPSIELGTGINVQWVHGEHTTNGDRFSLRHAEAFWALGLGASYYINSSFSLSLRYNLQNYFNSGLGSEHLISIGVGFALQNLFGFEPEPPEKL